MTCVESISVSFPKISKVDQLHVKSILNIFSPRRFSLSYSSCLKFFPNKHITFDYLFIGPIHLKSGSKDTSRGAKRPRGLHLISVWPQCNHTNTISPGKNQFLHCTTVKILVQITEAKYLFTKYLKIFNIHSQQA